MFLLRNLIHISSSDSHSFDLYLSWNSKESKTEESDSSFEGNFVEEFTLAEDSEEEVSIDSTPHEYFGRFNKKAGILRGYIDKLSPIVLKAVEYHNIHSNLNDMHLYDDESTLNYLQFISKGIDKSQQKNYLRLCSDFISLLEKDTQKYSQSLYSLKETEKMSKNTEQSLDNLTQFLISDYY